MANANPNDPPSSGVEVPSRWLMGLEENDVEEAKKFDKALEDAFGPQKNEEQGTEGEGEGEGTETPPETPAPESGATEPPTAGASAGGTGEGGEGQETDPGAIGGEPADLAALFQTRYGRVPNPAELQGLMELADWAASLSPDQQQAINQALYSGTPQTQTQPIAPTTPTAESDPELAALIEEFGEDHPLVKRLQRIEQAYQGTAQLTAQQEHERVVSLIDRGSNTFKEKYSLTDDDLTALQGAVAQSRILPGFVQANNGDVATAAEKALEYAYWQTPTFRQRAIDAEIEKSRQAAIADDERKRKAASVTGTGGNGASRTAPPPKTNDERWGAVTAGIAEAMNNGQQN